MIPTHILRRKADDGELNSDDGEYRVSAWNTGRALGIRCVQRAARRLRTDQSPRWMQVCEPQPPRRSRANVLPAAPLRTPKQSGFILA